ncbi:alpha beta-hydrolase [Hygrophoropsis aurantiaca]|uniref:Alpha beta-hydrolase n=1 Tax=Hygrophoropsis aurantiaca TaxID=72124 RepID=A0ACB8AF79_9AGAM|nr:alpha beta-hydrolase [Hygrophoropsis aurantiaca]
MHFLSTLYNLAWITPLVIGSASTNTTARLGPPNAICTQKLYHLDVSSYNYMFQNVQDNANMTYLTKLNQEYVGSFPYGSNFTDTYEAGMMEVTRTYAISGILCVPLSGEKNASNVQYLIHGIGYDSSYWDFVVGDDETYSYVYASAAAGIATFRYDRLGTGLSEAPPEAYNVVQKPTDVAIAIKFAEMLRSGEISGKPYTKIVLLGHSYGSIQSQALTALAPTAVDGVVLTGYSANATALPLWWSSTAYTTASLIFPTRFSPTEFTNAYLVTESIWTSQLNNWYFPGYSQTVADYARATEQPVTQGVLFTNANNITAAPDFKGDVLVVTGAQDWIFCYSNCYAVPPNSTYPNIPAYAQELYPAANYFSTYLPENTGHIVNLHYSAPETYQQILQFAEMVFTSSI